MTAMYVGMHRSACIDLRKYVRPHSSFLIPSSFRVNAFCAWKQHYLLIVKSRSRILLCWRGVPVKAWKLKHQRSEGKGKMRGRGRAGRRTKRKSMKKIERGRGSRRRAWQTRRGLLKGGSKVRRIRKEG